MTEIVGNGLYISFAGTAYAADYRAFDVSESIGLVESSAGADTYRTRIATLRDGSGSFELVAQAGNTVIYPALKCGNQGTLIWAEEGTATSKPKHMCTNAMVKSRAMPIKYDDLVVYKIEFQFNVDVTDSVWP